MTTQVGAGGGSGTVPSTQGSSSAGPSASSSASSGSGPSLGSFGVPPQYQSYVANAAAALGIPESVVAAQIELESGYNPKAVSPAGAEGIAQFMPGTWAQYGSGSPFDPAAAFRAYVAYMQVLLQQEGGSVQNALAAYNAGEGNLAAGMGYANTILSNAGLGGNQAATVMQGSSTASVSNGGGTDPFVSAPTPTLSLDALKSQAPLVAALVEAVPELKNIFQQAISGGWTTDKFISAVQNSQWWAQHSSYYRNAFALMESDPATWNQNVTNLQFTLAATASQLGANMTQSQLNALAIDALQNGYDQNSQEIASKIAQFVTPVSGIHFGGTAGDDENQIRQGFQNLGVTLPENTIDSDLKQIIGGTMSVNDVLASIRTLAAKQYPAYANLINQGVNVSDIASPYVQQAQNLLEQGPGQVNVFSPLIKGALQNTSAGKPAPLSLTDFENQVRASPAWQQTDNARDAFMNTGLQVLQDMGFYGSSAL